MDSPQHSSRRKTYLVVGSVVAAGVVVAIVLATISGNGKNVASTSTTSSSIPTSTVPSNFKYNARKDVTVNLPCTYQGGQWVLTGTLKNSASYSRNFQISVDFVTTIGATDVDSSILEIPAVRAGATKDWSVSGASGVSGLSCVIQSVRAIASN